MPDYILGLYCNGARGIRTSKDVQDTAAQNLETLLATLAANQGALSCFKRILVRYSRDNAGYARRASVGPGGNIVQLWSGIRDFDLRSLGGTTLSPASGAVVNAAPYFMLSAAGLQSFVSQMQFDAPDNLVLWCWGHGQGPGVAISFTEQNLSLQMKASHYQASLINHLKAAKSELLTPGEIELALANALPSGKKLALINFESCSVCTLELASSVIAAAKFMIASQAEIDSQRGWQYASWPSVFCERATSSIDAIATGLVENYYAGHAEGTCITLLDLTKVPELLFKVGAVATKALADDALAAVLVTARKRCFATHSQMQAATLGAKQRVDMGMLFMDAANLLEGREEPQFASFAADCHALLNAMDAVIRKCFATPDLRPLARGLSIWFPYDNTADSITEYSTYVYFADTSGAEPELTEFKKHTKWDQFIKKALPKL